MTLLRVTLPDGPIRAGEKIELVIADVSTVTNPYNPALIRLDAEIIAPDSKTTIVPGFAQGRCERQQVNGETRYRPTGGYDWKGRCAAPSAGEYRGRVIVTAENSTRVESTPFASRWSQPNAPPAGSCACRRRIPAAFAYEDGTAFIPVGENRAYQTPRDRMYGWIAKPGAHAGYLTCNPTPGCSGTRGRR